MVVYSNSKFPSFKKHQKGHLLSLVVLIAVFCFKCITVSATAAHPVLLAYKVEPFYKYRSDGKPGRVVTLTLKQTRFKGMDTVTIVCNSITETTVFKGTDSLGRLSLLLPAGVGVDRAAKASIAVRSGGIKLSADIRVPAARHWTVFIYPHAHVDIGYTGLQEDVEKIHLRNIDVGIDLAKKTSNYPAGARFIWNTEATWVVKAYLSKATAAQKQAFFEAVKKGWVQIDAGHSNMNTTTCSDEELMRFFKNSNDIEKQTQVPITSMVQMDVPGAAWGLVPAAVQNGVTGFISFPNNYDLRKIWEHKPFYWKGPDGKSKLLFLQAYPYGIGYTIKGNKYGLAILQTYADRYDRVSTPRPMEHFVDAFLFRETARLEQERSPYDYFVMTWSMADNCVIDADLPEAVKQWNETYAYPRLVIAGAREILAAYEKKYGKIIPEYSGDFTEFWTNGLGSDAAHVGMGRHAKENLVQAGTLAALMETVPEVKKADSAWENILLSAEHTWGYQHPGAPLAKVIEKRKASFFSDAEAQSVALLHAFDDPSVTYGSFSVVNTLSWDREGFVTLEKEKSSMGDKVIEVATGKEVPSQRLSTGALLFRSGRIPALASKLYRVVRGASSAQSHLRGTPSTLSNEWIKVKIDTATGNIISVIDRESGYDYVSPAVGLNSYHYLPGVYNGNDSVGRPVSSGAAVLSIKENGPLMVSVLVQSQAPGTHGLTREISLYAGQPFLQIKNTFDKTGTREKEGIHFGFAFHLPGSVSHVDAPWSVIVPEQNQLKGANRNWMTFQRWVDIADDNRGVTWTAIESPLIEWGELSGTILDGARQFSRWKKKLTPSQTLYSWPLNNHWDTNFPLEQSGKMQQQYALLFHREYRSVTAFRFGTEQHRPLLAIPAKENLADSSFVRISNPQVALSLLEKTTDKEGWLMRLRSFSSGTEKAQLIWPNGRPKTIYLCNAEGKMMQTAGPFLTFLPFGIQTLWISSEKQSNKLSDKQQTPDRGEKKK
ncbi:glycoside hydrolase family 38 N-terminal domain-containing protein [Niabella ginsenosidivorans]|uniref:glycoside hydrolase family 38 N-terminal domain-containing protein n=1 Tax=Niabella ginsenosidivorans TaxID=1176587 RepID=UPI0014711289|nr:glycoside hydrolase family 38 C-terminal domain-containing protein [Niabella ginsenosidivorans]